MLRTQTERLLTLHDAITVEIEGLDADVKRAAKGNPVASNRWLTWILFEIVVTLKLAPGPASP